MLGEFRVHVPTMYNYLDVFFEISGLTKDTAVECLLEEMEILRHFHSKHNTRSFKDTDTIIGLLRHCLLHDAMAEKRIQNKQCAQNILVHQMDELLNIEVQGSKSTDMEVDTLNPIAATLKTLKLSSMERTPDSFC